MASFKQALEVQDACNLRAVARLLVKASDAAANEDPSTLAVRHDPAVVLIVAKLAHLCGLEYTWPRAASKACEVAATKGEVSPWRD